MSADNGIYVLSTLTENGNREFRVAHAQAIENIEVREPFGSYYMDAIFGNSEVFSDSAKAFEYAIQLHNQIMNDFGIVEYGICQMHFDRKFPSKEEAILPEGFNWDNNI